MSSDTSRSFEPATLPATIVLWRTRSAGLKMLWPAARIPPPTSLPAPGAVTAGAVVRDRTVYNGRRSKNVEGAATVRGSVPRKRTVGNE